MFVRRTWFVRVAAGLLVALPILTAGCATKPTAVVSGKVTYRGRPLPVGTVMFLTSDNKILSGEIKGDGDYSVPHVPPGEVKISVSVPSPNTLKPQQKGMYGKAGDNPTDESQAKALPKVIKIPDEYANAATSNLKYTVTTEAAQTYNIELK